MSVRLRFAEFELDPAAARLTRAGEPVPLSPRVFQALLLLLARPGGLVSNDTLYRTLWPDTYVRTDALARVARQLRVALGDDPARPRWLEAVPGRGYRLVADVEQIEVGDDDASRGELAG